MICSIIALQYGPVLSQEVEWNKQLELDAEKIFASGDTLATLAFLTDTCNHMAEINDWDRWVTCFNNGRWMPLEVEYDPYRNWLENQNEVAQEGIAYVAHKCDSLASVNDWAEWENNILTSLNLARATDLNPFLKWLNKSKYIATEADDSARALYLYINSWVSQRLGKVYESLAMAKDAVGLYRNLGQKLRLYKCLKNISVYSSRFNDHQSAIYYADVLLNEIDEKERLNEFGKDEKEYREKALSLKSEYYLYLGNSEEALEYIDPAIGLATEMKETYLTLKARILTELGRFDESNEILEAIRPEIIEIPELMAEVADILAAQGNYKEALAIREEEVPKLNIPSDQREYLKEYQKTADLYYTVGNLDKALEVSHEVLTRFCPKFKSQDVYAIPENEELIPEAWVMEALFLKGKIFQDKFEKGHSGIKPDLVIKAYDRAIFTLNLLRDYYNATGSKYGMSEVMFKMFSQAIAFATQQYESDQNASYLDKALEYSQYAKAFVLKESISQRQAFKDIGVSEELTSEYFSLLTTKLEGGHEDYLAISDSLERTEAQIFKEYPSLKGINVSKTISLAEIKASLNPSEVLLHYFVDESHLYCFAITSDNQYFFKSELPDDLVEISNKYIKALTDVNFIIQQPKEAEESFMVASNAIYNMAVEPLKEQLTNSVIEHLIIVPDGFLKQVSFSNLTFKNSGSWQDPASFLINQYAVSYLHHTDELSFWKSNSTAIHKKVSIGITYDDDILREFNLDSNSPDVSVGIRGISLAPLPYAGKEARDVANKIGADTILNANSSFDNVLDAFSKGDLIHFAGHSIIYPEDFTRSYIPVYKNEEGRNKIKYATIQKLAHQPELVVLSACNTNNGQNIRTEGILSMSRAFTESGAKSILGSNWNAPDQISYDIINLFYDHLLDGSSKAKAIQQAQLDFLSDDKLSSPSQRIPAYWSNWALHGKSDPLQLNPSSWWKWVGVSVFIIFLGLYWTRRKTSTPEK